MVGYYQNAQTDGRRIVVADGRRRLNRTTHVSVVLCACLMLTACDVQIQQHPKSVPFRVDWVTPEPSVQTIGDAPAPSSHTHTYVNSSSLTAIASGLAMAGAEMSGSHSKTTQVKFETIAKQTTAYGLGFGSSTQATLESNGGFNTGIDLSNFSIPGLYNTISSFLP